MESIKDSHYGKLLGGIVTKLASRKSQKELLKFGHSVDLFPSLRIKVGKVFSDSSLEDEKINLVNECRKNIIDLSTIEAENDISKLQQELKVTLIECQNRTSKDYYLSLCKYIRNLELIVLRYIGRYDILSVKSDIIKFNDFVTTQKFLDLLYL